MIAICELSSCLEIRKASLLKCSETRKSRVGYGYYVVAQDGEVRSQGGEQDERSADLTMG